MMRALKSAVKAAIDAFVAAAGGTKPGRYLAQRFAADALTRTRTIVHRGTSLTFAVPNALALARAETFSTKEPETLDWIDSLPEGCTLWDVGANVGTYSVYAAKARGCRVYAFEPSVFNLELLARNAFLNGLTDRVTLVPLPLSREKSVSRLNMSSVDWGGAMSTFGQEYGHDGRPLGKVFSFSTVGLSMADAVSALGVPAPDFVKMDVDGIEHLILAGGAPVLRGVKGVLIEINDEFAAQAGGADESLRAAGLRLEAKKRADIRTTGASAGTYNQIWVR